MSTLTQFVGGAATTTIVNFHSSGGTQNSNVHASGANGAKEVLSGSLNSGTLATVLSVSGAGSVPILSCYAKDATARTVRLKVTVDGAVVFDATSSSVSSTNSGIYAAGSSNAALVQAEPIIFNSSLLVEVASSLTENNLVAIGYALYKR